MKQSGLEMQATGIYSYGCGKIIPEAIVMEGVELPEDKPRLLFVNVGQPQLCEVAYQALRHKVAVALIGATDENLDKLLRLSPIARRNGCALALLESWRYIPAVAAMKEIVSTGCLGGQLSLSANSISSALLSLRQHDIASWLGAKIEAAPFTESENIRLELKGENGWIHTEFSLDGSASTFCSCLHGHQRERIIPAANPLISELAVLAMILPENGRIKQLPMMMTL